ncbi:MAG: Maf family protein [Candidatus Kapabacteria bacterium]|jgi:septum formation protein|nr:Maf family protein [Candidatus Kapabacteria bacterium]
MQNFLHLHAPLVLASASPRRKKLLEQLGLEFRVVVSSFDEDIIPTDIAPADYVQKLARSKALHVAETLGERAIIIGADTTVVLQGYILNKPRDSGDAVRMLSMLSNRVHEVYTGIAIVESAADGSIATVVSDVSKTEVRFRALSTDEIRWYVATGSPLDKAGSYGIQDDFGAVFVESIQGCYYNVVGLPLQLLYRRLQDFC